MPNPSGYNQFGSFGTELPYGDVQRQAALERIAPVPTPSAVNAPDRAHAHATGEDRPEGETAAPPPRQAPPPGRGPVSQPIPPIPGLPRQVGENLPHPWRVAAADPGASALVREYAQRAQTGG